MHVRNRLFANGTRWLLITAALLGCTGVGLAAYTSHGLGFIADPVAREAALLLTLGVLLFSGLIYLRIFTGVEALRPLVPWGGTSLMLGWLAIGVAALDGRQVR